MRIIFFGTSTFAARILAKLIDSKYEVIAVITRPDRAKGRHLQPSPPPVKELVQKLNPSIPVFQPEKASAPEFAGILQAFHADLFVVVAYGEIIKKNLLTMPKLGCINIHASLLPKYRGAAPIQRALMAGEKETGITIIEMSEQMDAGDVLAVEALSIPVNLTFGQLELLLCELSCKLLFEVIGQFEIGAVVKTPQEHALATLAPKLKPEEEEIDWTKPASLIHNQVRALSPSPGASTKIAIGSEQKRLKIKRAQVIDGAGEPGAILTFGKEGFVIACGEGALRLIEVQLEGKKAMIAGDFIRGIHSSVSICKK